MSVKTSVRVALWVISAFMVGGCGHQVEQTSQASSTASSTIATSTTVAAASTSPADPPTAPAPTTTAAPVPDDAWERESPAVLRRDMCTQFLPWLLQNKAASATLDPNWSMDALVESLITSMPEGDKWAGLTTEQQAAAVAGLRDAGKAAAVDGGGCP